VTRGRAAVVPLALGVGAFAEWAALRRAPLQLPASSADVRLAVLDFVTGVAVVSAGYTLLGRAPGNRLGRLLVIAGAAWFLGTLAASGTTAYAELGGIFVTLHRGPLVHALLSAPSGRLTGVVDRLVVSGVYAVSAVPSVAKTDVALAATAAVVAAASTRRTAGAVGPTRAATAVPLLGACSLAAVLVASAAATEGGAGPFGERTVLWTYDLVIAATAVALAVDVRHRRWVRSTVTQLVVDLGHDTSPIRDRLARVLGDASLEVGYFLPEQHAYVDERGGLLDLSSLHGSKTITHLEVDEAEVGVLIHGSVPADRELLDEVGMAARVAIANVRLGAEIRRQVAELAASRRRIVVAADAQRRRLEEAIHRGPEEALSQAGALLDALPAVDGSAFAAALRDTREELRQAREELADFARGVHPRALTDFGLATALEALTRHAPVRIELDVAPGRLPASVEETAYFVCAEALANATKHAQARRITVRAHTAGGALSLQVEDDGTGGATRSGSGLRGLADRVESLGGTFELESLSGRGTSVVIRLPYEDGDQR